MKFLKALEKNNNRPWFESHRADYERSKADFLLFVADLIKNISSFDNSLAALEAKNCIFRINRDVRFSKDKSPYKNNMAAYFNKDGKKGIGSGYYLHMQPGKSFAAAGIWMPEPAVLANIRQEIDYNLGEWKKIISNNAFKKTFIKGLESSESLSRPPKGYDADNPAIDFLKMKSFIVTKSFTDADVLSKGFAKEVSKTFSTAKAMIGFLNRAID